MPRSLSSALFLTLLTLLACSTGARAQQYWDGGSGAVPADGIVNGGSGTWGQTTADTNWTTLTGTPNTYWGNGAGVGTGTAIFTVAYNIPGLYTVTIGTGSNLVVPGMTFNTGGYTIAPNGAGAPITLTALTGTTVLINTVEGATTISAPVAGSSILGKTGAGMLILTGTNTVNVLSGITLNAGSLQGRTQTTLGGTASLLTLNGGAGLQNYLQLSSSGTTETYGNNVVVNGTVLVISDDVTAQTTTITKSFGTLLLNGTLFNQNNALNGTGGTTALTFGATTLAGTTSAIISRTFANTNLVSLASVTGTSTNFIVGGNGATTITGSVDLGTGNLTKYNTGTLTLGGSITTSGSIIISQETTGSTILAGAAVGTQNINVNGGGFTLGTIASGTLNRISDTASLTLAGGNFLVSGLSGTNSIETIGSLNLGVGTSRISAGPTGTFTQAITFTNMGTVAQGAAIDFTALSGNGLTRFTNAPTLTGSIIGGWATTGSSFASLSGTNAVIALASSTTGTADFSSTATVTTNMLLGYTAGQTITTGTNSTINSLNMTVANSTAGTLDLGGHTLTLVTGGMVGLGGANQIYGIVDGYLTAGTTSSAATLYYNMNAGASKVNLGATITDNGAPVGTVSLALAGINGAATYLSAANTYTGKTYLENGATTVILTDRQFGAAPTSFVADNITLANGSTLQFAGNIIPEAISTNRGITLAGGGGIFNFSTPAAGSFAFSNTISGVGSLGFVVNNANTLTLSGNSTYDGVTYLGLAGSTNTAFAFTSIGNIGGGASSFGSPTTAANGRIVVGASTNGVSFYYVGAGPSTTDRQFEFGGTGTPVLYANGAGALTLNGNVLLTGSGSTLQLQGYGVGVINGNILQTSTTATALKIAGSANNIWRLTGENTFTGATTITTGILEFNTIGNIGAGPSSLGAPTAATGTITFGNANGILRFIGNTAQSTDRFLNVGFNGSIQNFGSAPITFIGGATMGTSQVLTLGGTGTGFFSGTGALNGGAGIAMTGFTGGLGNWTLNTSVTNTFGGVTLNAGTLNLDYSNLASPSNLIATTTTVALNGGILSLVAKPTGTVTTQNTGQISLGNNTGSILKLNSNGGSGISYIASSFSNGGGTLDIQTTGTTTVGFSGATNAFSGSILYSGATYNSTNFATSTAGTITAFTSYSPLTATGTNSLVGVFQVTGSLALTGAANTSLYGLKLNPTAAGQSLNLGSTTSFAAAGGGNTDVGILFDGTNFDYTILGAATFGNGGSGSQLYLITAGTHALTISAPLLTTQNQTGAKVTKTGTGTLILSGNNTYFAQTMWNSVT